MNCKIIPDKNHFNEIFNWDEFLISHNSFWQCKSSPDATGKNEVSKNIFSQKKYFKISPFLSFCIQQTFFSLTFQPAFGRKAYSPSYNTAPVHLTPSWLITSATFESINHIVFFFCCIHYFLRLIFHEFFGFASLKSHFFCLNLKWKIVEKNAQKHTIQTNRMKTKDLNGTHFPSSGCRNKTEKGREKKNFKIRHFSKFPNLIGNAEWVFLRTQDSTKMLCFKRRTEF